jgi:glycosyltransferase involved in cell wall biosynthesis
MCSYIPHGTDLDVYKPFSDEEIIKRKKETFNGDGREKRFVIFYNSRNARRKMTNTVVEAYAEFARKVGKENVYLLMKTSPHDPEGSNLFEVARVCGIGPDQISFAEEACPNEQMAVFYNIADVTINISNNEGFGLSVLESLACGTPVIINKTGGLPDQALTDEGEELGVVLEPKTRTMTGSQQIPYIYDDRNSVEQVVEAFVKLYEAGSEKRKEIGKKARTWVEKKFDKKFMCESWQKIIEEQIELYRKVANTTRIKFGRI